MRGRPGTLPRDDQHASPARHARLLDRGCPLLQRDPAVRRAHVGNDLGAIRNYVALQDRYESIYCIVDFHALTTVHDPDALRSQTREMAAALLALGLDPTRCTLFVQSHRPEVTELMWLFATVTPVSWLLRTPTYKEKRANQPDDVNHGLLTYPVLQAADIVLYKASVVPVGKDQAAHLELSREIVRAFNARYGETFPEPQAVHTEAPIVLGTDGAKKMSKSIGNTIEIFAPEDEIRRQVMGMVTDTLRIKRTDPGHPERCNVCQLHRFFGDDYAEIWEGERTARTGCVDTKKLLVERLLRALRRGAGALRRAAGAPGAGGRGPRGGGRAPEADRRRDARRGPREDGPAVGSAEVGPVGPVGPARSATMDHLEPRPELQLPAPTASRPGVPPAAAVPPPAPRPSRRASTAGWRSCSSSARSPSSSSSWGSSRASGPSSPT